MTARAFVILRRRECPAEESPRSDDARAALRDFFCAFARRALRIMAPGAHLFIATNPLLSHLVYVPLMEAGFEKRGEIIRLVQTLRGGDRPKNAHREFAEVTVMPRSVLGALGTVPQAMRRPRAGQSAKVENRRLAPHVSGHALRGRDSVRAYPLRGKSDCSAPVAQAASLHAPDSEGLVAAWRRHCARSVHGRRLHDRRCAGGRLRQYRDRRRLRFLCDGSNRDSRICASRRKCRIAGAW